MTILSHCCRIVSKRRWGRWLISFLMQSVLFPVSSRTSSARKKVSVTRLVVCTQALGGMSSRRSQTRSCSVRAVAILSTQRTKIMRLEVKFIRTALQEDESWCVTWIVFMTPLARTAIFPATVFTPCLNWAMSGPEGSTLSKPDALPEGKRGFNAKLNHSRSSRDGTVRYSQKHTSACCNCLLTRLRYNVVDK